MGAAKVVHASSQATGLTEGDVDDASGNKDHHFSFMGCSLIRTSGLYLEDASEILVDPPSFGFSSATLSQTVRTGSIPVHAFGVLV